MAAKSWLFEEGQGNLQISAFGWLLLQELFPPMLDKVGEH